MAPPLELSRTYRQNIRTDPKDTENCVAENCWQTEKRRKEYEHDVQNALNRQETDLLFWKKELEQSIDRISGERKQIRQCISTLEYHSNFQQGLLHSVKRCQDLRYFQLGAGNVIAGDETHRALSQENQLLTNATENIERQKKEAENMQEDLHVTELGLIEELKRKVSSLEASKKSDCLSSQSEETEVPNNTEHHLGDPVQWENELERRLDHAAQLLDQSRCLRNVLRDAISHYTASITSALCKTASLLQRDEETSNATKERVTTLLSELSHDIVLTRERNVLLRTEIGKQKRHIQAITNRMHIFRLKPVSEHISDEPLTEMQDQIAKTKECLKSLEESYESWSENEKDLLLMQRNLRQSLERANRTFFLYKDEVKGQRRSGSDPSSLVCFERKGQL